MTRKEARKRAKEINSESLNSESHPKIVAEVVEDLIMDDYYVQIFENGKRKILT